LYQRLFRALSTDIDYKKAVELRKEKSLNQNKKAKRLIQKLIIKLIQFQQCLCSLDYLIV